MVILSIPDPSLILLVGPSGSGKSTFARKHFAPTEILSSDRCRALVCDDEADQSATPDAFDVLRLITRKRLARSRLTVIDATNVQKKARARLLPLAFQYNLPAVAVVFDVGEESCRTGNAARPDRVVPADVIREQREDLERALPSLAAEGFRNVYTIESLQEVNEVVVCREAIPRGSSALPS